MGEMALSRGALLASPRMGTNPPNHGEVERRLGGEMEGRAGWKKLITQEPGSGGRSHAITQRNDRLGINTQSESASNEKRREGRRGKKDVPRCCSETRRRSISFPAGRTGTNPPNRGEDVRHDEGPVKKMTLYWLHRLTFPAATGPTNRGEDVDKTRADVTSSKKKTNKSKGCARPTDKEKRHDYRRPDEKCYQKKHAGGWARTASKSRLTPLGYLDTLFDLVQAAGEARADTHKGLLRRVRKEWDEKDERPVTYRKDELEGEQEKLRLFSQGERGKGRKAGNRKTRVLCLVLGVHAALPLEGVREPRVLPLEEVRAQDGREEEDDGDGHAGKGKGSKTPTRPINRHKRRTSTASRASRSSAAVPAVPVLPVRERLRCVCVLSRAKDYSTGDGCTKLQELVTVGGASCGGAGREATRLRGGRCRRRSSAATSQPPLLSKWSEGGKASHPTATSAALERRTSSELVRGKGGEGGEEEERNRRRREKGEEKSTSLQPQPPAASHIEMRMVPTWLAVLTYQWLSRWQNHDREKLPARNSNGPTVDIQLGGPGDTLKVETVYCIQLAFDCKFIGARAECFKYNEAMYNGSHLPCPTPPPSTRINIPRSGL
ncbi:hypothetical protein FIBSPDRAFT_928032, partial [Athelia psychrophila]